MNVYQYLPPHSAHPRGMMRGIIYSLCKTYHWQNTKRVDYEDVVVKLFKRHVARGLDRRVMQEYMLKANAKLNAKANTPTDPLPLRTPVPVTSDGKDRLFLHMEYHPDDIPRKHVRALYERHCKELFEQGLRITQTTAAYSRPQNISEALTWAKLHQESGKPASKYYKRELFNN